MRKCKDDGLTDVYLLLQLLLQKCAARALLKQSKDPADIALNEVRFIAGAFCLSSCPVCSSCSSCYCRSVPLAPC